MDRPVAPDAIAADAGNGRSSFDVALKLRSATASAHERLEATLRLLPPERSRLLRILEAFKGFHQTWEPAVKGLPAVAALMRDRGRIDLLEADLAALGRTPEEIAGLPVCASAAGLAASRPRALGSVYVMEGSTLGGQLTDRALRGVAWVPRGGFSYFNPYRDQTGARWRQLRHELDMLVPPDTYPEVESGALACFALLDRWMSERLGA